jgi:two-component system sensor histidine kinase AlgZ
MHPILSDRKKLLPYLLVWLCLGLPIAFFLVQSGSEPWWNAVIFSIPVTMAYGQICLSAYFVCRAFPLSGKNIIPITLVMMAAAAVSSLLWIALGRLWISICEQMNWLTVGMPTYETVLLFGIGTVLYVLSATIYYLMLEFDKTKLAERRELESKLGAQEAELKMLRTQIDPHFLFNSLNSISALTSQDPARAREMTLKLSEFFRQSLNLAAKTKIPLNEEMRLNENFLAIEKIRFGSRLQTEMAVDDPAALCQVPPMILQPLIENAIKHGVEQLMEGGVIRISARCDGARLRLSVENPFDREQRSSRENGIGLTNITRRLQAIYGDQARIDWIKQENTFRAEITLPVEMHE